MGKKTILIIAHNSINSASFHQCLEFLNNWKLKYDWEFCLKKNEYYCYIDIYKLTLLIFTVDTEKQINIPLVFFVVED